MRHTIERVAREPLFHFLLLGLLLFVLYGAVSDGGGDSIDGKRIEVTADDLVWLQAGWEQQWNRPPTRSELEGLVDAFVREEVLYREAVAAGLDRDDTIVRRRMVQKMEFLFEDLAVRGEPTDEELVAFYEANPERYEIPPGVSFSHVYFSTDQRGATTEAAATAALAQLRERGVDPVGAREYGDRFMLPHDYAGRSPAEVAELFGSDFAESLFALTGEGWQGPIASAYGLHLVNIYERFEASSPELDEVRDEVSRDYLTERRQEANEAVFETLLSRYEIVIDDNLFEEAAGSGGGSP